MTGRPGATSAISSAAARSLASFLNDQRKQTAIAATPRSTSSSTWALSASRSTAVRTVPLTSTRSATSTIDSRATISGGGACTWPSRDGPRAERAIRSVSLNPAVVSSPTAGNRSSSITLVTIVFPSTNFEIDAKNVASSSSSCSRIRESTSRIPPVTSFVE